MIAHLRRLPSPLRPADLWPWLLSVPLFICAFALSVFFQGTDSPFYAPAVICLFLFAGLLLYPSLRSGQWDLPRSATAILSALFGLYIAISPLWSQVPYVSTIFAMIIAGLPFLFLVLVCAPNRVRAVNIHTAAMGLVILGFALWALVQYFFLFETYGPRIRHPMLSPNNLAGLFNLGLLPAMALFFVVRSRGLSALWFALFLILYIALLATQSRGALFSFLIAGLVLLPVVLWRRGADFPVAFFKAALCVSVVAVLPFALDVLTSGNLLQKNLSNIPVLPQSDSYTHRLLLWESTWQMIKNYFWLGTGLGTFYFYYPQFRHPSDSSDGFFAHMDPLQYWAEAGVMAPLLFYAVLVAILIRTIHSVFFSGASPRYRLMILGPFCGMLALTLHTHIDFHLYMPAIMIPLAVLMAYWYIQTEQTPDAAPGGSGTAKATGKNTTFETRRTVTLPGRQRQIAALLFILIMLITSGWVVRWAGALHYLSQAQTAALTGGDHDEVKAIIEKAGRIGPPSYGKDREYLARLIIGRFNDRSRHIPVEEVRALYHEAMAHLDYAQARNPHYTQLWDLRARLYYAVDGVVLENGRAQAQAKLEELLKINPLAADSRLGLLHIYTEQGESEKAHRLLEEGLRWPRPRGQTDVQLILATAKLRAERGDDAGAAQLNQEALRRARRYGLIQE